MVVFYVCICVWYRLDKYLISFCLSPEFCCLVPSDHNRSTNFEQITTHRKRKRSSRASKADLPAKKQQCLLDISNMSYRELQKQAKARGIRANQSKAKLQKALAGALENCSHAEVEDTLASQNANVTMPDPLKEHSRNKLKVINGPLWAGKVCLDRRTHVHAYKQAYIYI